jgi:hypothetical protein
MDFVLDIEVLHALKQDVYLWYHLEEFMLKGSGVILKPRQNISHPQL